AQFLQCFGTDISLLDCTYKLLIEFVPITLDVECPYSLFSMESSSNLALECIKSAVWIKKPLHRKKDQKVTHTIFTFNTIKNANIVVCQGLNIEGHKACGHRHYSDPTRYYHCQILDHHFIKNCPKYTKTCRTYGNQITPLKIAL
ncbi:hypothetical protein J3R82DRAFT_10929, partial [Butyriboletus roseoflavus]